METIDLSKYSHVINVSDLPPGASGYVMKSRSEVMEGFSNANLNLITGDDLVRKLPDDGTYSFPPSHNSLEFIGIKNQRQNGACAGASTAQVGEGCSVIASGGEAERYSWWAQYMLAQEDDKLRRRNGGFSRRNDKGSTPTGNATAFMNIGLVPDAICPPGPATYDLGWEVTDEMRAAAADHKIKTAVYLKSVEHVKKFLQSGMGYVTLACRWMAHFDRPNPEFVLRDFKGPQRQDSHGGGHQVALMGWYTHPKYGLCFVLANSWSERWMDDGAVLVTAGWLMEAIADPMTILIGYSDLLLKTSSNELFVPRKIEVDGGMIFGRRSKKYKFSLGV